MTRTFYETLTVGVIVTLGLAGIGWTASAAGPILDPGIRTPARSG